MELTTRPRLDSDQRCPYCHDHLEVEVEAAITCPACGTEHHAACVRELDRCTTMGCERPLEGDEEIYFVDPAIRRAIRRRFRERAKRFVERNVRRVAPLPNPPPTAPPAGAQSEEPVSPARASYFREAKQELERALELGQLEHAEAAWVRLNHLWNQLPVRVKSRLYPDQAALGERLRAAKREQVEREVLAPGRQAAALGDAFAWGLASAILIGAPLFALGFVLASDGRRLVWALPLTVLAGLVGGVIGYRESPHASAGAKEQHEERPTTAPSDTKSP